MGYGLPKIGKNEQNILYGETESRKKIPAKVEKEVYKRAKGRCECCGTKLKKNEGDFHHWRSPRISPTAKTVQFLCLPCHRKHGHKRKVITHTTIWGKEKEVKIIRIKVRKRKKKRTKKKSKRRTIRKKRKIKEKITGKRRRKKRK